MDRIEAALDRREAAQERHRQNLSRDYEQLMNWQVLMQDKMDKFSEAQRARLRAAKQRGTPADIRAVRLTPGPSCACCSEDRDRERKRLDQLWENTDKRIADLVAAIGKLIER